MYIMSKQNPAFDQEDKGGKDSRNSKLQVIQNILNIRLCNLRYMGINYSAIEFKIKLCKLCCWFMVSTSFDCCDKVIAQLN